MESSSVSVSSTRKDPCWKYATAHTTNKNTVICNFCGKETNGGICRAKKHLVGGYSQVKECLKCPPAVKEEIANYMVKHEKQKNAEKTDGQFDLDAYGIDLECDQGEGEYELISGKRKDKSQGSCSSQASKKGMKSIGPMDLFFKPNVDAQPKKSFARQATINELAKKELREDGNVNFTTHYDKPSMGYIYGAIDRAKATILKSFNDQQDKCKDALDIIDRRWECQLHHPLHAAGYFLNTDIFYDDPTGLCANKIVMTGLYDSMEKLLRTAAEQRMIQDELPKYINKEGLFGRRFAQEGRKNLSPAEWWKSYGCRAPRLQKFAISILSLTCTATGCERNWSVFQQLHTKRRNRLSQSRLNDLVFIKYNMALLRRHNLRDRIDPIMLNEIDESNEWLIGRMEEDENEEFVFDSDILTWDMVDQASGVSEPYYYIRSKARAAKNNGKSPMMEVEEEEQEAEISDKEDNAMELGVNVDDVDLQDDNDDLDSDSENF